MLHLLRRMVKTWVARVLLALLIASFAIWGIGDIFIGRGASTVAHVGDTEISADRYARVIRRQQVQMTVQSKQAVSLAAMREARVDQFALTSLIREAAYAEELARLGIRISNDEVAETIRKNPAFVDSAGRFDMATYRERLNQAHYEPIEFEQATRAVLDESILSEAVRVGEAPRGAAELIAKWQGETRAVSTLALLPESAAEPADPADDALKAYFDAHTDAFREPERRWGRYIRLNPAEIAKTMEIDDAAIQTEYEARKADFTTEPKRTVEQIVFEDPEKAKAAADRIAAGEASFAEIAAEQNISVADLSLGEVGEKDLPDAVSKALFASEETGVIGPIDGPHGQVLLNVTNVVKGGVKPIDEVREELKSSLALRQARGVARQHANEVDELRASGLSLEQVAEKLGVPVVKFAGLAADSTVAEGDVPALAADPKFTAEVQAAGEGDERDVIELTDSGYALVVIDKIVDAHLPTFEEARPKVLAAWKAEERLKELEAKAADLIARAGEGGMAAIATELGDEPAELPAAPRNQLPMIVGPELRDKVFAAKQGDILVGRTPGDKSVLIVLVREVVPLEGDALAERVKTLDEALSGAVAADTLEYYSRAIQDRLGASVNTGAIDQVFERLGQTGS